MASRTFWVVHLPNHCLLFCKIYFVTLINKYKYNPLNSLPIHHNLYSYLVFFLVSWDQLESIIYTKIKQAIWCLWCTHIKRKGKAYFSCCCVDDVTSGTHFQCLPSSRFADGWLALVQYCSLFMHIPVGGDSFFDHCNNFIMSTMRTTFRSHYWANRGQCIKPSE